MTKRTNRQDTIIQGLGEELNRLEPTLSVPVAKGIIHYSIGTVCAELDVELAQVQEYTEERKIQFVTEIFKKVEERLPRYKIGPERAAETAGRMLEKYKSIM